ncbi:MAG: hypothetical protein ABIN48_04790 [Ginsengibacter sp.]
MKQVLENQKDYNVLVTILTDGAENASKEYSGTTIKTLVEELKLQNWTFTYIGADHDVEKMASSMSIANTMTFEKNENDMKKMFSLEKEARLAYSLKIRKHEDTNSDYYNPKDEKNDPLSF